MDAFEHVISEILWAEGQASACGGFSPYQYAEKRFESKRRLRFVFSSDQLSDATLKDPDQWAGSAPIR